MLCLCAAQWQILISNRPRTGKFSQLLQAGKAVAFAFSHHSYALVTLWKFDRWVHVANLCIIWKLAYCRWRWQGFVWSYDVLPVFFHWMYKTKLNTAAIKILLLFTAGLFTGFLVREMRRFSKSSEIRFRKASFSKMSPYFTLLDA